MLKLADQLAIVLSTHAELDSRIRVLDGDLCDSDGAIEFARRRSEQFIMAGIAEQNMVSMAGGMAAVGLRPWVFSFAAFLAYRACDQIRVSVCQPSLPVVLVGSHAGGLLGRNGKTHTALNDVAVLGTFPNMELWAPADEIDVALAVRTSTARDSPTYIRLPRLAFGSGDVLAAEEGLVRWIRPIQQTVIVSTGLGTRWACEAVSELEEGFGVAVGLLHLPRVQPLPQLPSFDGVKTIVIVEDHVQLGGLGSRLLHAGLGKRIIVVGWPMSFTGQSGSDSDLRRANHLSSRHIAEVVYREAIS